MKRLTAFSLALFPLFFAVAALFGCANMSNQSGWITLVDGAKGMDNFTAIGDANWRAEDGAIVADKEIGRAHV